MFQTTPSQLLPQLIADAKAAQPSMIWGSPGIGKSDICYQLSRMINAKMYELRVNLFDPLDVRGGLKVVEVTDGVYRTYYGQPAEYPDSDYQGTVVLFLDELPNATKATQNALLQLLLNKKIGSYELPPNTVIVGAGNMAVHRASTHDMPTPVRNRFAHYFLEPDLDDWCAWCYKNNVNPQLPAFMRYRPQLLNNMDVREHAFPTPRSWFAVHKKLPFLDVNNKQEIMAGVASLVGAGPAGEFVAFQEIYTQVPDLDDIVANPGQVKVPTGSSVLYAVSSGLAAMVDAKNIDKIFRYVKRMPIEFQIVFAKDALGKDKKLVTEKAYMDWATENATAIL